LLKARISAREPPSRAGPSSESAGRCFRDDRTQSALARLGERESRTECPSRVRAEVLSRGQGETTASTEIQRRTIAQLLASDLHHSQIPAAFGRSQGSDRHRRALLLNRPQALDPERIPGRRQELVHLRRTLPSKNPTQDRRATRLPLEELSVRPKSRPKGVVIIVCFSSGLPDRITVWVIPHTDSVILTVESGAADRHLALLRSLNRLVHLDKLRQHFQELLDVAKTESISRQ
jgi:hypothetical protein